MECRTKHHQLRINPRLWLPKLCYAALPWFYLGAGALAVITSLYIEARFRLTPWPLVFAAFCTYLAAHVFLCRWHSEHAKLTTPG